MSTPIVKNIQVQLDKMAAPEAATYQGSDPHFTYRAFTNQFSMGDLQLVRFRDYVIDQVVIDAVTGALRKYLIVNDPEPNTLTGYWSWTCVRYRGT